MLEELKGRAQKSAKTRIIGWAITIVVLMIAPLFAPIQMILGPKDLTGKTNLDYSKYEGKYVSLDVSYVLGYYMEEYTVDKSNRRTSTNKYGYIVYNYDDNSCVGVWLPKSEDSQMQKKIDATLEFLLSGTEASESKKVKGTLKPLTGQELDFYKESIEELEEYIPGIVEASAYYYIVYESVNRIPTYVIYLIYIVCAIGVIMIIVSLIQLLSKKSEKDLNKFIAANPGVTEAQIDSDMRAAVRIGKKNAIFAGQRFTVWQVNTAVKILDNSKLVWAYYYRVTGRNSVSQTRIFNIDHKMIAINASKDASDKLLSAYVATQPHMIIGYKSELEKQYNKDFRGFLDLCYNNAGQNSENDGYTTQFNNESTSNQDEF